MKRLILLIGCLAASDASVSAVGDWRLRGAADDWRPAPPSSIVNENTDMVEKALKNRRNRSAIFPAVGAVRRRM